MRDPHQAKGLVGKYVLIDRGAYQGVLVAVESGAAGWHWVLDDGTVGPINARTQIDLVR